MITCWFSNHGGNTAHSLAAGLPPAAVGVVHAHSGPLVPCESGLHGSPLPSQALKFATAGLHLWRVEMPGDAVPHGTPVDKYCGSSRRFVAGTVDCRPLLPEELVAARARYSEAWAGLAEAGAGLAEAGAGLAEAGAAFDDARAAYSEAWAGVAEAGAAFDDAWAAYSNARARFDEAGAAFDEALAGFDKAAFDNAAMAALDGMEEEPK